MFIDKLDIVNACLRSMGETKLNTLEDEHVYKDDALTLIDRVLQDVSSLRLWFNTEYLDLLPQADTKYIMLPTDVIDVHPSSKCGQYLVAQRGRRLYDAGRNRYEFDRKVTALVARLLDFELLPHNVQMFVRDDVVLRFQNDFDGDNSKYQKIKEQRDLSFINMKAEHVRHLKANPLYARASLRVLRDRYHNFSGHPWHAHVTYPS